MHAVQRLLQTEQDHGWGRELEVLIYVYWLAHGLSYIVVARVFNVPKSTVHRVLHKVANYICRNLRHAVALPQAAELAAVGQGFAQLSGSPAFTNVVIASCAFLHNVCLDNGDLLEPDEDVAQDLLDPQPPREPLAVNESSGNATWDRLAAQV
ncbi:hypothetical protein D5F01_LYC22459 [Larimichthys crocea]|uniref:Nuclease HARBI1 n=1 Tax=Larimichthys crocea TaxID=215358 RepID=A0A6G0HI70_LARCR|nr:hypothetical protein D5F01_LYC22459 [Larimichthys crocea]